MELSCKAKNKNKNKNSLNEKKLAENNKYFGMLHIIFILYKLYYKLYYFNS